MGIFDLKTGVLELVALAEKWDFSPALEVMLKRHAPTEEIVEWELSMKGGPCPLCKTPFRQDKTTWRYGDKVVQSKEWLPSCRCYRMCMSVSHETLHHGVMYRDGCGRLLIVEKLMGLAHCTGCGGRIL